MSAVTTPVFLSEQLHKLLKAGKFERAEEFMRKGVTFGPDLEDLWSKRAIELPGTTMWEFMTSHQAPGFLAASGPFGPNRLFKEAWKHGRLDLADWLEAQGHQPPADLALTVLPANLQYTPNETQPSTLLEVWQWAMRRPFTLSPSLDGRSAAPDDLLRNSLVPALFRGGFESVVNHLIEAGADLSDCQPTQSSVQSFSSLGVPEVVARQKAGTPLHALAHLVATSFDQNDESYKTALVHRFVALSEILVHAGADASLRSPQGETVSEILRVHPALESAHRASMTQLTTPVLSTSRRLRSRA